MTRICLRNALVRTDRPEERDNDQDSGKRYSFNVQTSSPSRCSLVDSPNGGSGLRWIMTTLQMAPPAPAEVLDTPEAQEARWNAWKSKGAAADRIAQRRVRVVFTAILIALAGMLAVML